MAVQQFCLRWNNHQPNFISVFSSLLNSESLVDVTLAAEGRYLQAHKVVLSACSSYFQSLFTINPCQHPIVILKDVKFLDLKTMVDFMYYGEVNVSQEQLPHILKTAEMLKIKGLAEMPDSSTSLTKSQSSSTEKAELLTPGDSNWSSDVGHRQSSSPSPCPLSPASRRKRLRKSSTGSGSASTERTSEEQISTDTAVLASPTGSITKTEPGTGVAVVNTGGGGNGSFSSDGGGAVHTIKQHSSTDSSDTIRDSSQESIDEDHHTQHEQQTTRSHVTLQMSQPEVQTVVQTMESQQQMVDMPGPSTSVPCSSQQQPVQIAEKSVGSKRGRFLMRQPRVKKDSDPLCQPSPELEIPTVSTSTGQYLTVPPMKMERQCSEPSPNFLSVPTAASLVKQHSHPLLPSQLHQGSSHSSSQSHHHIPFHHHYHQTQSITSGSDIDRAVSPVVIVGGADPLSAESTSATTPTLRVRTEELRRASSSPQTGSPRSSHCPVVRPGPALGCNFCWNTIDGHGRILRRKTKYHCPECQTNLCIVPCFQEYHERQASGADPSTLTTAVQRLIPKTSSI